MAKRVKLVEILQILVMKQGCPPLTWQETTHVSMVHQTMTHVLPKTHPAVTVIHPAHAELLELALMPRAHQSL